MTISDLKIIIKSLTHALVIPILLVILLESLLGLFYYLIPLTAYLTIAKNNPSKDYFFVFLIFVFLIFLMSWADEPLIDATLKIGIM